MFGEELMKIHCGRIGQVERFPTVPTERISRSTLAQRPEPAVSNTG